VIVWKCSKDGLQPQFLADVEALLGGSEYEWHVMYGYRSLAEQDVLYQKHLKGGPLAAAPGHSAHNFGLAVDVQLITDEDADWNEHDAGWVWLFDAVANAPRLHSGKAFGDDDHIERVDWRDYENWNK
jgi:hypothetical protein